MGELAAAINGWRPLSSRYSLNARVHWATRKRLNEKAKLLTVCAIKQAGWPSTLQPGPITITIQVWQRIGKLADSDNLTGCCKAIRDAIAQWFGVDDGPAGPIRWVVPPAERGPDRVTITVEET